MPTSVCSTSPGWMSPEPPQKSVSGAQASPGRWKLTYGMNQAGRSRSANRWRMNQATSSVVVTPGVITRLEKASLMTPRASATIAG